MESEFNGLCGMIRKRRRSVIAVSEDDWITYKYYRYMEREILFEFVQSPRFPNPFDAYFYLLENYKEEEIV